MYGLSWLFICFDLWSSYDVIVDVAPEIKWVPEDGYKNLKVVVEIDSDIDAQSASEQELKRRHKSLGSLRIVTDRGLQVKAGFSAIDVLESLPKPNLNLLCTFQEYWRCSSSKLSSVHTVFLCIIMYLWKIFFASFMIFVN